MPTDKNQGASAFARPPEADAAGVNGYRWTCPICGESRTNLLRGEGRRENAINALRTHVMATDGNGHGPKRRCPADLDTLALAEHVTRFDVR